VKGLDDVEELGAVEDGLVCGEQPNDSDSVKEFHSVDELSEEVDEVFVLIGPDVLHNEGRRNDF
jgi:hypothetical protein